MKLSANLKKNIILLSILLFTQNTAFAQKIKLTNLKIDNTRDDLLVYVNIQGVFQDKIKESVLTGVPGTISFFIELNEVHDMWIDKKIADLKITHMIKYNALKKEFVVRRSWEKEKLRATKSFTEAQQLMNNVDHLKVVPLNRLEKGRKYQIRIKAEIINDTQAIDQHYFYYFLSKWDLATQLYTIDFIY